MSIYEFQKRLKELEEEETWFKVNRILAEARLQSDVERKVPAATLEYMPGETKWDTPQDLAGENEGSKIKEEILLEEAIYKHPKDEPPYKEHEDDAPEHRTPHAGQGNLMSSGGANVVNPVTGAPSNMQEIGKGNEKENQDGMQKHHTLYEDPQPIESREDDKNQENNGDSESNTQGTEGKNGVACQLCTRTYQRKDLLKQHLETIHGNLKHPCSKCEFNTKWRTSLERHIRTIHDTGNTRTKRIKTCNLCGFKTGNKSNLREHMDHVHDEVFHTCECGFNTRWIASLSRHIKLVHNKVNNVNHSCNQCNYQTRNKSNLKKHIRKGHKNCNYPCDQCNYQTDKNSNLRRHIRKVHNSAISACNRCNYQTHDKSNLNRHIRAIHLEISQSCNECGYQAKWGTSIARHKGIAHRYRGSQMIWLPIVKEDRAEGRRQTHDPLENDNTDEEIEEIAAELAKSRLKLEQGYYKEPGTEAEGRSISGKESPIDNLL